MGLQFGAATMEKSMEVPQKTKVDRPYDSAISLLGIYPNKMKTLIQKDIHTPMFIAALFTIAKIWKQPRCPMIDNGILHSNKKE